MPDVENSSPLVDPSQRRCNAWTTILHVVMVTTLFSVIMYAYIYLYCVHHYAVASLVIQIIAYLALGCLYIYNSSCRQDKFMSAGYLVLVMSVFLISPLGIYTNGCTYGPVRFSYNCFFSQNSVCRNIWGCFGKYLIELAFWANMVAIFSYCVWKCSFILQYCRLKKLVRTILHGAIVTILLVAIIFAYVYYLYHGETGEYRWQLIQLVAYNAVGYLYICNSSGRKEKVISAGRLVVLVLLVFLLSSFANTKLRTDLIFGANIVAICSYCIWKLYPWIRRWLDALDAHTETEPREPARQQEAALLQLQVQQTPFRIRDMPKEFSSDEIQSMTQDFGSMIGRGGSAQVFRGNLDDGTPVAIKRVNIDTYTGRTVAGEEDFRRELSIIANVHHRSLVRLLGYCLQRGGGLYLVYPFFENGSLDRWIFHGSDEQRRQLTWPKRLCIAVDVARALAYLHNECHWRILHLDVKPGNILLDGNLCAHVSDFGISLSITRGLTSVVDTEHLKGTFGYMAPEMLYNAVSHKSDVFSYGMTLLELVGGRRNMYPSLETPDFTRDYFPYIVREKVARGEVLGAVDAAIEPVDDEEAVKAVLKVALCCIQNQREMRPSMQTVVDMLEGRVAVELPLESRHHLL